jgi:HTH DNA binding domain
MKLEAKIPNKSWLGSFSRHHPELVLECINLVTLPGGDSLGEYEIFGSPKDWTSEIARSPDVVEVENLEILPGVGRYRVRFREVIVAALATQLEIIVRYPRTVRHGILEVELIARLPQMRRLVRALREAGNEPRLVSLRRDSLRSVPLLLTPVQRTLFRQALASGYFEVPRRITLTGLAKVVSRDKSSVSRTLATVERKLAEVASVVGA